MARIHRRDSFTHEEYGGGVDALERMGPYGRVTNRECRLLQRLLPHHTANMPKGCKNPPAAEAVKHRVTATSVASTPPPAGSSSSSTVQMGGGLKAVVAAGITKKECEKLADILLTEVHGGGAFLPVSCRRVELQKRRVLEREQERGTGILNMRKGLRTGGAVPIASSYYL
uniref:Uncharacterized protein n=1 Tax=Phaeomonas parva TaxID=124430 RepID=A0A7S1TSH6_9STRA|mmetsp:Transcript_15853/g.48313  ORF Transcript_15853/g.48313 Transcript_15853/m.48313 type:complete len:171 (+) Transcript_15853:297-809(+)